MHGDKMECVAREPQQSDLLWYDFEHGKCSVVNASETRLVFEITVDSAVLFTNAPYKKARARTCILLCVRLK